MLSPPRWLSHGPMPPRRYMLPPRLSRTIALLPRAVTAWADHPWTCSARLNRAISQDRQLLWSVLSGKPSFQRFLELMKRWVLAPVECHT